MTGLYHFGLLGHNISYSLSPKIFTALFASQNHEGNFSVVDVNSDEFETAVEELRVWHGFSVTIPYKERIIPYLKSMSREAQEIGAANSVRVENGQFHGYNTDAEAFIGPLRQIGFDGKGVLILGNGGAARAVIWALKNDYPDIEISVCGRDKTRVEQFVGSLRPVFNDKTSLHPMTYSDLGSYAEYELIVNCTPAGRIGHPERLPLPESFRFRECQVCYDLNYRPVRTPLMLLAERAGCRSIGGFPMLVRQAAASYNIWTGHEIDLEMVVGELMKSLLKKD
jgi:shikimate dehydrogenase